MKVPPAINQFTRTLDKNQAAELFKLLVKIQPETKAAKTQRLEAAALAASGSEAAPAGTPPPPTLKATTLTLFLVSLCKIMLSILVVFACAVRSEARDDLGGAEEGPHGGDRARRGPHRVGAVAACALQEDGRPLLHRQGEPAVYPCVRAAPHSLARQGKARLGTLTHKKTAAVLAVTSVPKESEASFKSLQDAFRAQFNETVERRWGGGEMGRKTKAKLLKRQQQIEAELAKKRDAAAR